MTADLLPGKVWPCFPVCLLRRPLSPITLPPIARVGLSELDSLTGFLLVSGSKSNLFLLIYVFSLIFMNVWICGCVHDFAYLWALV